MAVYNMASRGILSLGSQMSFTRHNALNVSQICIQTLRSQQRRLLPFDTSGCMSSGQRHLHVITPNSHGSILIRKLSSGQYRDFQTSPSVVSEEAVDEELGDFNKCGVSEAIQRKLRRMGIKHLFPVQYRTFQRTLEGTDVIVQSRTGTGKTLSFALPIIEKLNLREKDSQNRPGHKPLVLVLAPTRELACQVNDVFVSFSGQVKSVAVFGGAPIMRQIEAIKRGVDVVVGTPGRVKDLLEKGLLDFSKLEHVILDEVDRMLDMGFEEIVEEIISSCYRKGDKPQTMLYSATVPDWVKKAARKYLDDDYEMINLVGDQSEKTSTTIKQYAVKCNRDEKPFMIKNLIDRYVKANGRAMVFCQTKLETDRLSLGVLRKDARAFHGDIAQESRLKILQGFKDGHFKVLITTDVAARGLDIPNVDLVIQAQPPSDLSFYIHRVGRTGRAGQSGMSILLYDQKEKGEMESCQSVANVIFQELDSLSVEEVIEGKLPETVKGIKHVSTEIAKHFYKAAESLIEEKGAQETVAAAMAVIMQVDKFDKRSLINREMGYTTLMYEVTNKADLPQELKAQIHGYLRELDVKHHLMLFCKNGKGVVFDVKSEDVETVLDGFENLKILERETLQVITALPEVYQDRSSFQQRGSSNRSSFQQRGSSRHVRSRGSFERPRSFNRFKDYLDYDDDNEDDDDDNDFFNKRRKRFTTDTHGPNSKSRQNFAGVTQQPDRGSRHRSHFNFDD